MGKLNLVAGMFIAILLLSQAAYDDKKGSEYFYAAALAYCPSDRVMSQKWMAATKSTEKLGMIPLHSLGNNQGYNTIYYTILLREKQKEIVIGFSGTIKTQQLVDEIVKDLPTKYNLHDIPGALVLGYFDYHYTHDFREDLHNKIKEYNLKYPNYNIVFVGHSLGGALTVHAAADLILTGLVDGSRVSIFTYGQPRVGNSKFNVAWSNKVKEIYRLVHFRDIVSHLPTWIKKGSKQGCESDGFLPYYPYHPVQEIFYDKEFIAYKECDTSDGEDQACSNAFFNFSIDDHTHYFGIEVGEYHNHESEIETEDVLSLIKISQ